MSQLVVSTECPTCSGPLDFSEGSNAIRCPSCGSHLLVTGRKQVLSYWVKPRVKADVAGAAARTGRLDLMFNNAGIVWGGDTELLTLDQWNAIIDVNIRGVVHGVAAAYPLMVRQGHGHIVNTASMAGLTAAGQITSYVTTKHAVVGLSLALRSEAVTRGVGVLVVCPAAVETPILDKGAIGGFVGRNYFLHGQGVRTAYDPDRLARDTLRAIEKNKALLVKPRLAHAQWLFARLSPTLMQRMSIGFIERQRASQAALAPNSRSAAPPPNSRSAAPPPNSRSAALPPNSRSAAP